MKEGWTYKKLGDVADFYRGLTYGKQDEAESSNICVLRSNNIDLESMKLNFDEIKCLRPDFAIPEDKKLKSNSIFICMSNGSKQHVGKVAFIDHDMEYAFGGFMGLIVPTKEVLAKYLYYVCRSSLYRRFLTSIGNGIGITNLKFSDLDNFSFPFSYLSEQQKIVSELDLLNDVIDKQKAQIEELDKLAQSSFYDMFGDPITNEKGWEKKKYEEFGSVLGGYAFKSNEFVDDGIPVLKIGNINTGVLKVSDVCFYPYNIKLKNYEVRPGDLTISLTGTTGKDDYGNVCLIPSTYPLYYLNQRNAILKIKDGCNNCYLQYVFKQKTFKMELTKNNHGIRQANILNKDILGLSIPLPPLALQQEFAAKVEAIEQMKAKVRQSLKESEELFNSRMDYYFN